MHNPITPKPTQADPKPWYGRPAMWVALGGLVFLWLLFTSSNSSSPNRVQQNDTQHAANVEQGFDAAIHQLNDIDNSSTPIALQQIVERINQWLQVNSPDETWRPDAMIEELTEAQRSGSAMRPLGVLTMQPDFDKHFLYETALLRHVSQAHRGADNDPRKIALKMFDWTVRNIQVDQPGGDVRVRRPLDALLIGHADPDLRAWVFMELCRQQGLYVVQLAVGDPSRPESLRPWAQALLHEGQLYLFDMAIGLPIAGPEGRELASLAEVAAADSLLRQLDVSEKRPYPVVSADVQQVTAWIATSPVGLSRRMQVVESRLAGENKLVLSTPATALAAQLKAFPQIAAAHLWSVPYHTVSVTFRRLTPADTSAVTAIRELAAEHELFDLEQALAKGRSMHLRARFAQHDDGPMDANANKMYQISRYEGLNLRRQAEQRTRTELERREKRQDPPLQPAEQSRMRDGFQQNLERIREYASYWLGLAALERGQYDAAEDYLLRRTLQGYPDGLWFDGARYNLARLYEMEGKPDVARELYEQDTSEQRHGSLLRAKWLREKHPPAADVPQQPAAPPPAEQPAAP